MYVIEVITDAEAEENLVFTFDELDEMTIFLNLYLKSRNELYNVNISYEEV